MSATPWVPASSVVPAEISLEERAMGPAVGMAQAIEILAVQCCDDAVQARVRFADASTVSLTIEAWQLQQGTGHPVWWLRLGDSSRHDARPRGVRLTLNSKIEQSLLLITVGALSLSINLARPSLCFRRRGALLLQSPGDDLIVGDAAASHALFKHQYGRGGFGISFGIGHGERFFGGGESFQNWCKNGLAVDLRNADALGVTGLGQYQTTPYLWSSVGYGLAMLGAAPTRVDVGATRQDILRWCGEQDGLSLLVQAEGAPKAMWQELRTLTHAPRVVPSWTLGLWLSRCYYQDQNEVEAVLQAASEHKVAVQVLNLDARCWMRAETRTDFVWDESRFEPYQIYIPSLRERGIRVCLWENPYVSSLSALYQEGVNHGYFARTKDGQVYPLRWVPSGLKGFPEPPPAGLVDFTNPQARRWWQDQHRPYIRAGVSAFKTDFGEEIPSDAYFADGSSGLLLRNAYADLYNLCVTEVLEQELPGEGVLWARSGWMATAATPVKWAGDSQTHWRALRASLRAGLSQAVGGALYWSHDVGGFYGPKPDAELYLRWAQLGLYGSHVRLHGTSPREPWMFGESALRTFRDALAIRTLLLPYFQHCVDRAIDDGSVLRPLLAEYPDDIVAQGIDDQFFLGQDLLVAPFLDAEGGRRIYLPAGDWVDLRTGDLCSGSRFIRSERTAQLPAFARVSSSFMALFRSVIEHRGAGV